MFGPRRMLRRAMGAGGPFQQKFLEGQQLMTQGRFVDAANVFKQIGEEASGSGRVPAAVRGALLAGRAYIQAKQPDAALAQARRALDWMVTAGSPMRATRAMPMIIALLRGHGYSAQASTLEKETTKRLAEAGLKLGAFPGGQAQTLPPTCPQCAGPLRSDSVEWIDAASIECPWCGSTVKAI